MAGSKPAASTDGLQDAVSTRLRRVNQRVTANRRAIVEALSNAARPMTIPELLESPGGRGLAQSSVYRNLAVLEQAGVVRRIVTTADFARFELAEDLTGHHHHLICSACGSVEDFTAPDPLERTMSAMMQEVSTATGFAAEHHRIDLVGRCRACA
jgi:Fe2+ or Zn2+ uptake regulation protein